MRKATKTKVRKSVEAAMSMEVASSAKRKVNTWQLTLVEACGKVFTQTDTAYRIVGTKQDAVDFLGTLGKVSTAREMLDSGSPCGYRTVDAFCVRKGVDEAYYLAERI